MPIIKPKKSFFKWIFSLILGYMLHFPFRLVEDALFGWLNIRIAEWWGDMVPVVSWFIENFVDWILPFPIAIGLIWLAFWLGSKERKERKAPSVGDDRIQQTVTTKVKQGTSLAQLRQNIGLLITEGTEVLKGFKSVHAFGDIWPTEEFKAWCGKVSEILLKPELNQYYPLWFRDVGINTGDSPLPDFIEACEAGLQRLEVILERLSD